MQDPLLQAFTDAAPAARAQEAELVALWRRGQAAWPEVALDGPVFARYLGERCAGGAGGAGVPGLGDLAIEDLYLACACVRGDAAALRAFDRAYLSRVGQALGDMARDPTLVDEVTQELREKLLVGAPPAPPQLSGYGGQGALEVWLRITALRLGWKRVERARKQLPLDERDEDWERIAPPSPELRYLQERHREDFAGALKDAFLLLSSKQRNLLRLRHLQGLTDERIGALYRVHQSTVTRWMAALHAELLAATQRLLRERLGLSAEQMESLLGVVRSQLEVSLEGMLRQTMG